MGQPHCFVSRGYIDLVTHTYRSLSCTYIYVQFIEVMIKMIREKVNIKLLKS